MTDTRSLKTGLVWYATFFQNGKRPVAARRFLTQWLRPKNQASS